MDLIFDMFTARQCRRIHGINGQSVYHNVRLRRRGMAGDELSFYAVIILLGFNDADPTVSMVKDLS